MTEPTYTDPLVTLYTGDCLDVLTELPDNSVDSVVTDPPYNLTFMGRSWDAFEGREDAGFGYWLAGLIDGEGHFAIKKHTRGTHAPAFALKMRADERGTLEAIKRHTGFGTINEEPKDGNPLVKWVVQDKAGCQKLVDLLDKYPLRAKKRQDYNIWREAVCEWTDRPRGNRWHGAVDDDRMSSLRGRLMKVRNYVEPAWSGHEYQDWSRLWALECFRVLKPGGYLLAFSGTRTYHRMTSGIEDAGFEIRDSLHHIYASGFPKSLDVSKALDKVAGAEREVVGVKHAEKYPNGPGGNTFTVGEGPDGTRVGPQPLTAPATDLARKWEGWGTALKPAHEPIVMARKPLVGTVAANVTRYGTGALNIDGTRIPSSAEDAARQLRANTPGAGRYAATDSQVYGGGEGLPSAMRDHDPSAGRWPSNVLLSSPELFDEPNPWVVGSGATTTSGSRTGEYDGSGAWSGPFGKVERDIEGDAGGYSRFFLVPKADRAERERGLAAFEQVKQNAVGPVTVTAKDWSDPNAKQYERNSVRANVHPTVKPIDLMRHLVRLVTPPGGVCLDPFLGSGTTALAASEEGFRCIGIEREAEYLEIAVGRLMATPMGLGLDVPAPTRRRSTKDDPRNPADEKVRRAKWLQPWKEQDGRTPKDEEPAA